jgi:hypothetical protein
MGSKPGKSTRRGVTSRQTRQGDIVQANIQKEQAESEEHVTRLSEPTLDAEQVGVYQEVLQALNLSGLPYAVGAAFARYAYTRIWRKTKDLDIFLRPEHLRQGMDVLRSAGFETEIREEHWLAKAWKGNYFIDLIFGTGHGQLPINDDFFRGCKEGLVLKIPVPLISLEEMIASAAYIAGRNRFDGPEVVHLIHAVQGKLNWQRILDRLGENQELLLWHLILFDFVYPGHSNYLPRKLMASLFENMRERWQHDEENPRAFRGTLLDPFSYNVDIENWGYSDQRNLDPLVDDQGEVL